MPALSDIESAIAGGLPRHETDRLDRARMNLDYYRGHFEQYRSRPVTRLYQSARYERTSMVMHQVVKALCRHLYARGPARSFPGAEAATRFLAGEYARLGVDATMQAADRYATVGDACALQVIGTGDPDAPVRIYTWPANQFVVWEDDVDPTRAAAVATIDYFDERRKLRLWTPEVVEYWETDKLGPGQTSGGTAYRLAGEEPNYFKVVPFAFVHFNRPSVEFWSGGPGCHLRSVNDYINYFFTEIGDSIRYDSKPIKVMFGVRDGWNPPDAAQPGDVWTPPPAYMDEAGNGIPPSIEHCQPDTGYVESGWADANNFLDHTFECNDIPAAAFRMVQSGAKSGEAIVQEQMPLILRAMGRQRDFGQYERDLARVFLAVARAELEVLGRPMPALEPRLADTLTLRWPCLVPDIPASGSAQDLADAAALMAGQASRTTICMRKNNFTHDEAVAHLKSIADDLAAEAKMGLPPLPGTTPAAAETEPETEPEPEPESESETEDG